MAKDARGWLPREQKLQEDFEWGRYWLLRNRTPLSAKYQSFENFCAFGKKDAEEKNAAACRS